MKAGRLFNCLFWASLYCVLYLVSANEDELMDFEFAAAKDAVDIGDWQFEDDQQAQDEAQAQKKLESNMLDFAVELEEQDAENRVPQFDWREKVLRIALSKALTDGSLRQKFVEVMPILRVLSSQQRLALSALISAQMNAKQGHELKLDQVRMMFGDDKKLLLPIVYDLANLVKKSARKYINLGSQLAAAALLQTPIQKRKYELMPAEQEDDSIGTIEVGGGSEQKPAEDSASLEDFFEGMQSEVLDPQMINEALQADMSANATKEAAAITATPTPSSQAKRVRRAANEFVHKLTRSVPISVNEDELQRGAAGRTIKLNTTAFQQPSSEPATISTAAPIATSQLSAATQSYSEIEDLAFAGLNGTDLQLSADERADQAGEEPLPNPEELIAGPRYRMRPSGSHKLPIKRKRVQPQTRGRPKPAASSHSPQVVAPAKKCERFTSNMCIRTDDYPLDQIMGSIRRHKNAMSALLAEFYDKPNNNLEFSNEFDDYLVNKKRREDEGSAGGMCQSVVRYARPQKARSASGEWKYIVNTGQHTQTLRLEKCSNPGESCSYLAQTYRSHCSQVYNYHRLLSWDKVRGLHVDIFKVPTCCSCQVDGYRQQFPPLSSIQAKEYTPGATYNLDGNGYSTINEDDLDYNEESDEDELAFAPFNNVGNSLAHRDTNELYQSSKKVRSKLPAPSTVGSYLSPPDDEDQYSSSYKSHKIRGGSGDSSSSPSSSSSSSSKKYYSQLSRRRPQHNEPRVDLDLAPSASHAGQEVNVFGPSLAGEQLHVPLKRQRIYSATHTASADGAGGGVRVGAGAAAAPSQTTAATSLFASAGAAASATHAHQAVLKPGAVSSITATTSELAFGAGNGYIQRNFVGAYGGKSRPRFYAPGPSTPVAAAGATIASNIAATSLSTESVTFKRATQGQQQHQSTALPQPPPLLNSIYGGGGGGGGQNGTKRINYSYHPIIDFFEKNKRTEAAVTPALTRAADYDTAESRLVEQHVYPHRIASSVATSPAAGMGVGVGMGLGGTGAYQHDTSHERRIGYGAGGGVGVGVAGRGGGGFANDNAWHPLVVAS